MHVRLLGRQLQLGFDAHERAERRRVHSLDFVGLRLVGLRLLGLRLRDASIARPTRPERFTALPVAGLIMVEDGI